MVWGLNALSCYFLSKSINYFSNLYDAFNLFFSNVGITSSTLLQIVSLHKDVIIGILLYFSMSSILLLLCSYIWKNKESKNKKYDELLPHVNFSERLQFLELYF